MTLILKRPVGAGLILKRPVGAKLEITPTNLLPDDPDAIAYLTAVEAADGQALEPATRLAFNTFVKGCKDDGTWPALKACCIMAGARTLAGALVPLVGPAPTNNGFVAGDYDRKTGLKGDQNTKHLNSNRNNNAAPLDNNHISCYVTNHTASSGGFLFSSDNHTASGSSFVFQDGANYLAVRANFNPHDENFEAPRYSAGLYGISRKSGESYQYHRPGGVITRFRASLSSANANIMFFRDPSITGLGANARLSYYSIGESLNLTLLDARVSALMAALAVAIP